MRGSSNQHGDNEVISIHYANYGDGIVASNDEFIKELQFTEAENKHHDGIIEVIYKE